MYADAWEATSDSNVIVKFADDTSVVGLIYHGEETDGLLPGGLVQREASPVENQQTKRTERRLQQEAAEGLPSTSHQWL